MQCVSIHALQQLCGMCVFDPLPLFVYTLCIIVYTVFTWPSGNICEVARLRALFMTQFEVRKCGNRNMSCLSRLIAAALKNTQGAQAYPDLIQTSICRPPTMEMVDNSPVASRVGGSCCVLQEIGARQWNSRQTMMLKSCK